MQCWRCCYLELLSTEHFWKTLHGDGVACAACLSTYNSSPNSCTAITEARGLHTPLVHACIRYLIMCSNPAMICLPCTMHLNLIIYIQYNREQCKADYEFVMSEHIRMNGESRSHPFRSWSEMIIACNRLCRGAHVQRKLA